MVERKLSINVKSENNLTALRHLKRLHWFPNWPLVSTTHTRCCVRRVEERTEGLSQLCIHLSVCFFIYTFVYSFIHLLLTSFWSSCHPLYNRWTVRFVCNVMYSRRRYALSVNRSPRTRNLFPLSNSPMTDNSMIDNLYVSLKTCSRPVRLLHFYTVWAAYFRCDSVHINCVWILSLIFSLLLYMNIFLCVQSVFMHLHPCLA